MKLKLLFKNETRCSWRRQASPLVPPPSELDKKFVSSLILAHCAIIIFIFSLFLLFGVVH